MAAHAMLSLLLAIAPLALAQLTVPDPGDTGRRYADGSFQEPAGYFPSYALDTIMNVSWSTSYEVSDLYLIIGGDLNNPVLLANETFETSFEWLVWTDSNNPSEVYSFRVANASGTEFEQEPRAFTSSEFLINNATQELAFPAAAVPAPRAAPPADNSSTTINPVPFEETERGKNGPALGNEFAIGVGVGVGIVVLVSLLTGLWFWRKSKTAPAKKGAALGEYEHYTKPIAREGFGDEDYPSSFQTQPLKGGYHVDFGNTRQTRPSYSVLPFTR